MKTVEIRGHCMSMSRRRNQGFTLIELMIVATVVTILMTIAVPSYQQYTRRAQRSAAMAALQGLAQAMERNYAQNNSYKGAATGPADTGAPRIYPAQSPVDGGTATYNLTISAATDTTYTLLATPIAGTSQAKDGKIQLDNTGARNWDRDNNASFGTAENNWNDH
jgi:type IV pilus assembly protein PilE